MFPSVSAVVFRSCRNPAVCWAYHLSIWLSQATVEADVVCEGGWCADAAAPAEPVMLTGALPDAPNVPGNTTQFVPADHMNVATRTRSHWNAALIICSCRLPSVWCGWLLGSLGS